jgi:hypothetical protein
MCRGSEESGALDDVMFGGMVLTEVVSIILPTWAPLYKEVSLLDAVSDAVEAHVYCLGSSLFYCVVGKSDGYFIVSLNWSRRLRVAHFCQDCADCAGLSGVVVEGCQFCFGGRGHNHW